MQNQGDTDDLRRYIEYLQESMVDDGWQTVFDASGQREWTGAHQERLDALAANYPAWVGDSPSRRLEDLSARFTATTKYELPFTEPIFQPILEKVHRAAGRLNVALGREIVLATSTNHGPSPSVLPSVGEHILFVGPGTSTFCNYWAKVYTALVQGIAECDVTTRISSADDLRLAFQRDPSPLLLAARLTLYYAFFGTLLGFGEVLQPATYVAYRLELLEAMETFVTAHEYAHMVVEEGVPQLTGMLSPDQSIELEYLCDELGLSLARDCAHERGSFLSFCGVGALIFFRAFDLSERARQLFTRSIPTANDVSYHPPTLMRIEALKSKVLETTAPDQKDQVAAFLSEYNTIAAGLSDLTLETISEAQALPTP